MMQESHGWMIPVLGLTKYFFGDVVFTWFFEEKHTKIEFKVKHDISWSWKKAYEVGGLMQNYLESNIVLCFIGNFKITVALFL